MKKEAKIKAVIFDVGGVLQLEKAGRGVGKYWAGVHEYIADKLEIAIDVWFDAIDTPYGKSFVGEISDKKVISIISDNLGISERKLVKTYLNSIKKHFKKNKELHDIVFKLKRKSYLVGILTDQWVLSKKILIPKKDSKKFDVVIISDEVGIRKPDIKIYKLLMKKLREKNKKIKASEVLFIDNREYNLKPAQKLGMNVILFKNNKQLIKDMRKLKVL